MVTVTGWRVLGNLVISVKLLDRFVGLVFTVDTPGESPQEKGKCSIPGIEMTSSVCPFLGSIGLSVLSLEICPRMGKYTVISLIPPEVSFMK